MKSSIVAAISFVLVCFAQTQAQAMMSRPSGDRAGSIKETVAEVIGVPTGDFVGYEDFEYDFNFTTGDYRRLCYVLMGDYQVDPFECENAVRMGRLNNLGDVLELAGAKPNGD